MGVGSGGRGAVAPLDFHTWYGTNIVDGGLIALVFGLFCYFSVFFPVGSPGNFSADALVCKLSNLYIHLVLYSILRFHLNQQYFRNCFFSSDARLDSLKILAWGYKKTLTAILA